MTRRGIVTPSRLNGTPSTFGIFRDLRASISFGIFIDPAESFRMKDLQLDPPEVTAKANPMAVSVRIKALTMSRARGQRAMISAWDRSPQYVDEDRICLNRVLLEPRPLVTIRDENAALRKEAGRVRAMKSNAAVVTSGIITFGHKAAKLFGSLAPDHQDAAFGRWSRPSLRV